MSIKLLFVVNVDWFFISHRLPIAIEALKKGYDVTIICENTGKKAELEKLGITFISLPFCRTNKLNIINEIQYLFFLYKRYKEILPDIVHHVTLKPILYGSFITKLLKHKPSVVNSLSGMGYLFTGTRKFSSEILFLPLLRFVFNQQKLIVIVQNTDDLAYLLEKKLAKKSQLKLIKGSGVNLDLYKFFPVPEIKENSLKVLLPARMLWDKGIMEFYLAATLLKKKYPSLLFILCGDIDVGNPSSVPLKKLEQWNYEGIVSWIGFQANMVEIISKVHIVVLPSYREGLPKSLIEACAIGRPIITSDTNGCRECVKDGENGFLVPIKDYNKISVCIEYFIQNQSILSKFGMVGRKKAEAEFDINHILKQTFEIYEDLF